ncbi:MAG: hypothetical protein K2Y29_09720 [Beijerinckiaceae bacterium]|nr:hypothetical protein [Beijerinckiaceae bacterium]
MAINPIPVTFHVRADHRPEFDAARRRRARPYRAVLQVVTAFCALGLGVGYFASDIVRPKQGTVAAAPAAAPSSTPEFRAPINAQRQPSVVTARASQPMPEIEADHTPVGSITRASGRGAPAGPFAPLVRAPDYQGFAVTAGR